MGDATVLQFVQKVPDAYVLYAPTSVLFALDRESDLAALKAELAARGNRPLVADQRLTTLPLQEVYGNLELRKEVERAWSGFSNGTFRLACFCGGGVNGYIEEVFYRAYEKGLSIINWSDEDSPFSKSLYNSLLQETRR